MSAGGVLASAVALETTTYNMYIGAKYLIKSHLDYVKFIYSEKAKKCCEIFTLLLSYVVPVKSKVKILKNIVAFSEYMNFIYNEYTS